MKTKQLLAITMTIGVALSACRNTDKTKDNAALDSSIEDVITDTSAINRGKSTAEFLQAAAGAAATEIQLSKIALQKASNPAIKKFAERMVKDHTTANNQLQKIAQEKGIKLVTSLSPEIQIHLEEMNKVPASTFDKHYIEMMVKDHIKSLDLFKSAATSGDVEVRNYAAKTLRVLETHFKTATELNAELK